jgi:D-alanine transaminase
MGDLAYVNGEFSPISEARISVDDRGYMFGDGVYEVVRTYGGKPWLLNRHQRRLERSLAEIGIRDFDVDSFEAVIDEGIKRAGNQETLIYYHITRGSTARTHAWDEGLTPNVIFTFRPMPASDKDQGELGVSIVTLPDLRWGRCDIKSLNLLANVMAKQQAHEQGAFEAAFVDRGDFITEGTSTSIFFVLDGVLRTHPLANAILPGITRGLILELANALGFRVEERAVRSKDLSDVNEAFLTGTTADLTPVVEVNGRRVGGGGAGPITSALLGDYRRIVHEFTSAAPKAPQTRTDRQANPVR